MPVELRKRPAPKEDPAPVAKRSASKQRTTSKAKQVIEKAKALVTGESSTTAAAADPATTDDTAKVPEMVNEGTAGTEPAPTAAKAKDTKAAPATQKSPYTKPAEPKSTTAATAATTSTAAETPLSESSSGKTLSSTALSTPITTHEGTTTTLSALLSASTTGAVIFTYPKASTPGCTTQACLFRDNYDDLRAKGYDVFGLSNDSEKANTTFKTKQNLQYVMLCDPDAKLTGVLGMKKPGNQKGTLRGVVVLTKDGKVEVWFQGGPPKTLDAVKTFLGL